ncbi:MAG: hypothetical protein HYW07_22180 [Candidatus Latescibacteria bacterium]|nr:hypothetical protein [Candidatus Latescibacterota bacterium]
MPRLLFLVSLGTLCLGQIPAAFAGAWTQDRSGYYLKIAAHHLRAQNHFDSSGMRVPKLGMGELTELGLQAYAEYGLRERLTLVAALPYKHLSDQRRFASGTGREESRGFGDLEIGIRWKLGDRPLVSSLAVGGKVPLGYRVDAGTRVPLGTGEPSGDMRLLLGRSLHPIPGYFTGEVGYRVRGGAYSDEFFYLLEAGFALRRWALKGYVSGLRTRGACGALGQESLIGDQDILQVSPGLSYRLGRRLDLEVDLIHTAAGCNTTAGSALAAGVVLRR